MTRRFFVSLENTHTTHTPRYEVRDSYGNVYATGLDADQAEDLRTRLYEQRALIDE